MHLSPHANMPWLMGPAGPCHTCIGFRCHANRALWPLLALMLPPEMHACRRLLLPLGGWKGRPSRCRRGAAWLQGRRCWSRQRGGCSGPRRSSPSVQGGHLQLRGVLRRHRRWWDGGGRAWGHRRALLLHWGVCVAALWSAALGRGVRGDASGAPRGGA